MIFNKIITDGTLESIMHQFIYIDQFIAPETYEQDIDTVEGGEVVLIHPFQM